MKATALALLLLIVAGCTTPLTLLRHPENGATVRCGGDFDPTPLFPSVSGQRARDRVCVQEHQVKGFVVVR